MRQLTLKMMVSVTFSKNDDSHITKAEADQLQNNLDYVAQQASDNGILTADAYDCIVDRFDYHRVARIESWIGRSSGPISKSNTERRNWGQNQCPRIEPKKGNL